MTATATPSSKTSTPPSALAIALAGMLAMATAMGIGRFAFTPLLPMMLADGVIDLHSASWLASANYLGYLVGALLCTFQPLIWRRLPFLSTFVSSHWVGAGLVGTTLLTLGMSLHLPALWPLLRFAAGVASSLVFVYGSGWCLGQLALRHRSPLGGVVFAGPGVGIVLSGLMASGMVTLHMSAALGWLVMAVLAALLSTLVWPVFNAKSMFVPPLAAASPLGTSASPAPAGRSQVLMLALTYGLAGFGYIITATFLPVIARQALPDSAWLDLFWALFGVGIIIGALLASRMPHGKDLRLLLAAGYFVQALGIAVSILRPTLGGFALGSLLLGIPFTAITFFAMQEVRRLRPINPASYIGLLTAIYGIGQIAGPPLVAQLLKRSSSLNAGFTFSLEIAALTLLVGAVLFLWMSRTYPMQEKKMRVIR
jgi:predicted MFS family arabinose efflux permease